MDKIKKPTYRQLEKQVNNGRELIHRVSKRMQIQAKTIEALKAIEQSAHAYIAYLVKDKCAGGVEIPKSEITKAFTEVYLESKESDDKTAVILTVKPREVAHDTNDDGSVQEADGESAETEQVQEQASNN